MTADDIYKIIMPAMEHCGCTRDAYAAAKAILPYIEKLYEENARLRKKLGEQ